MPGNARKCDKIPEQIYPILPSGLESNVTQFNIFVRFSMSKIFKIPRLFSTLYLFLQCKLLTKSINFSKNWNYVVHSRLNQAFHSTDNLNIGKIWISRETLHRDYKIEGAGKSYNSLPDRIDGQQSVQLHQKRIVQALIFLQDYKIYILKEIFCNTIKLAHK